MASAAEAAPAAPALPLRRTRADAGLWGWLVTTDHKRIGILYTVLGLLGLVEGGVLAVLIRLQLARPGQHLLVGDAYNAVVTMHGVIMIFFAATPILWGMLNYVIPLMIGARDVAFPRLNMFTFWLTLAGAVLLNLSWFLGGAPSAGWYAYVPLSTAFARGIGMDAYAVSLLIAQAGSAMTALNLLVTIVALRAPGMTWMKVPPLAWFTLGSMALVITAGLPFMVGLLSILFARWFGAGVYTPSQGGDVTLWLNLFWMFGHPEVYILALPAMGMITEVLATFARKPVFGYGSMVAAVIAGVVPLSWIVWAHHFYVAGLSASANVAFSATTELISIPMAIIAFVWIGTLWGGDLRFTTPMRYAVAALFLFLIGGLTGLVNGNSAEDRLINATYWIVAHFHVVILGMIVPGILAGLVYWWPKATGRLLSEPLGAAAFWVLAVGILLTFVPQFLLGLDGMPRRIYTYVPGLGWHGMNSLSTAGALIMALGVVLYVLNLAWSLLGGARAPADPWDGRSLEWTTPSPAPAYNFARLPRVEAREPLWHAKLHNRPVPEAPEDLDPGREGHLVHMHSPSAMPLVSAVGVFVAGYGAMLHSLPLVGIGGAVLALGTLGWALEDARGYFLVVGAD